jgi:hypothetical protein
MSANPWEEMTTRWREMYQAQTAHAQITWPDSQQQLRAALTGAPKMDTGTNTTALTEMWRSWMTLGRQMA